MLVNVTQKLRFLRAGYLEVTSRSARRVVPYQIKPVLLTYAYKYAFVLNTTVLIQIEDR